MLIGAVRGGHVEIVRALLNKYADIDVRGQVVVHLSLPCVCFSTSDSCRSDGAQISSKHETTVLSRTGIENKHCMPAKHWLFSWIILIIK